MKKAWLFLILAFSVRAFICTDQVTPFDQRWYDFTERITGYGMGMGIPRRKDLIGF